MSHIIKFVIRSLLSVMALAVLPIATVLVWALGDEPYRVVVRDYWHLMVLPQSR